ncbi:hypothetical protein LBMAG53_17160 [Planctomycetota bacterium]|nr:hypothetical protein LBMAG53_17160 [Planctomycetota bacterium]
MMLLGDTAARPSRNLRFIFGTSGLLAFFIRGLAAPVAPRARISSYDTEILARCATGEVHGFRWNALGGTARLRLAGCESRHAETFARDAAAWLEEVEADLSRFRPAGGR